MSRKEKNPKLIKYSKRKNVYYITWTQDGRRRERSTGTQDEAEAHKVFTEFLYRWQRKLGPKEPDSVFITDMLADYAEEHGPEVKSQERILYALDPLIDYWQAKTVSEITRNSCKDYVKWRQRSNGTIRRELGVLRAAINHGVAERRLAYAAAVYLPPKPEPKTRWLTKHEAAKLLLSALQSPKARLYLPLFIIIGLHTGQRKEAILSLKWSQVDLNTGRINWNPEGREQTNKRRPIIRMPSKLLPHLKRARLRGTPEGFVIHINGKRLKDIKKSFAEACKRAGVHDITPHTMRHTRTTWGMQAGANIWKLAGFLGMSQETLERTYGHHHPDFQDDTADDY